MKKGLLQGHGNNLTIEFSYDHVNFSYGPWILVSVWPCHVVVEASQFNYWYFLFLSLKKNRNIEMIYIFNMWIEAYSITQTIYCNL